MSKNELPSLNLFNEAAVIPSSIQVVSESAVAPGCNRIKFKAKLQEKEVTNNNNRFYSEPVLMEIVRQLAPKATERKLVCELDHPVTLTTDVNEKLKRSSTILLEKACILITKLEYDGRFIVAECETLTTQAGLIIHSLLKDGVVFGFSLRALGRTQVHPDGRIEVLLQDLKAITFDAVSNPSHSNAVIVEFINESTTVKDLIQGLNVLQESVNEIPLENEYLDAFTSSTSPEMLNESQFYDGEVKHFDSSLSSEAKQVLLESDLIVPDGEAQKYCIGNTCVLGTIEESISHLMSITESQVVVGFKF